MTVVVFANDDQWNELTIHKTNTSFIRLHQIKGNLPLADAYFILKNFNDIDFASISAPVFLNAVSETLHELNVPQNVYRINGWNGFLQRDTWEVVGKLTEEVTQILAEFKKQFVNVPDEPGMVTARIISMIINEAFFTLQEKVSTKNEIDIAMKLGTNYPFGPFEWADKIGLHKIYFLLQKLAVTDNRYKPAPLLIKETEA